MAIRVVRARPEQAGRLTQIAHAAKSYWGYPAQWIEMWHNQLTITGQFILQNSVYVAVDDDDAGDGSSAEGWVPLGFYALCGEGDTVALEHLWVQPRSLGAGVGRLLFEHAVHFAADAGAKRIEIESDPNAEGFYQRMGAQTVGEVTYEMAEQPRRLPLMVYMIDGALPAPSAGPETAL